MQKWDEKSTQVTRINSDKRLQISDIGSKIDKLGNELVHCSKRCKDIRNKPKDGILPRGMNFQNGNSKKSAVIIVGINPGNCDDKEKKYYIHNGVSYGNSKRYFRQWSPKWEYFTRARIIAKELGVDGPILWTNLCKCEGKPTCETFKTCTTEFLEKELALFPPQTPIIALGNKPYYQLIGMKKFSTVIGVPHPTGLGASKFLALFDYDYFKLKKKYKSRIRRRKGTTPIRLFPKLRRA